MEIGSLKSLKMGLQESDSFPEYNPEPGQELQWSWTKTFTHNPVDTFGSRVELSPAT